MQTQIMSLDTDRAIEEDRQMKMGWNTDTDFEFRQTDRGRQTDADRLEYTQRSRA